MWCTQRSPGCVDGYSTLVMVPPHSTGWISLFTEQCAQYTANASWLNVRPDFSRSVRYVPPCSSYRPSSINLPPLPQRNESVIFSSSSVASHSPKLAIIARAITFARTRAGSSPHSTSVDRRGRTNSSPVRRSARSTASSPSSSAMKDSEEVIQLIEYSWRLRHCATALSMSSMAPSLSPAAIAAFALSQVGVVISTRSFSVRSPTNVSDQLGELVQVAFDVIKSVTGVVDDEVGQPRVGVRRKVGSDFIVVAEERSFAPLPAQSETGAQRDACVGGQRLCAA